MVQADERRTGRYPGVRATGAETTVASRWRTNAEPSALMEVVLERGNLMRAYQRVVRNKGAAGVDAMTVADLKGHLQRQWPAIRERIRTGLYQPNAVRRVRIPKPQGGERALGIPTVQDRLIQQALHQVLSPLLEPTFSASSYGFRPGRSAHQAVSAMRGYIEEGNRWVVDIDLEAFFDRVNHDVLMGLLARHVADARVLKLVRAYLEAGVMDGGLISPRREGAPQGGPLSPLLSNLLLTELDRELERRGHRFCRYADDCNIYVRSKQAGERVMVSVTRFLEERLKLRVNAAKSAVDRPWRRRFLGYSVTWHRRTRLRVSPESVQRLRSTLRDVLRRGRGRSLSYTLKVLAPILRGWAAYYQLTASKRALETVDGWLRRKLRGILWRQWKRPATRARALMRLGLPEERACKSASNGRGPWWNSGASHLKVALPNRYFARLGLVSLVDTVVRLQSRP